MKTIEGNKLIAHFMGISEFKFNEYAVSIINTNGRYHSSWDWLMEAVDKIERMKYFFNSAPFIDDETDRLSGEYYCIIQHATANLSGTPYLIDVTGASTKIEAVWRAVVEFIQWHNRHLK